MTHPAFDVPRELLRKYATAAPRYTSYPTVVDWEEGFDTGSYPELLRQAARSQGELSVYVHVPFCDERCLFCGCNVVITRSAERVERYLDRIERELDMLHETGIGARRVHQYHWGGGTPTHLDVAQIRRLHGIFASVFDLSPDAEAAVEVDPRVTSTEQIEALAELGFNRISLGVQDFDPRVQKAIKRVQSEEETRRIVDAARAAGMRSCNVDLIYGLPHQTRDAFAATVRRVIDMRPERVALFHYAHVPWLKKHQTALPEEALPSADDKLFIFVDALEAFRAAGYVYIGLDHFALPGDELARAARDGSLRRNFMGYTTRRGSDTVAAGVSAIGEVAGAFVQNSANEAEYGELVRERGFATARGHRLSADDRLRRDVILALMCSGVVRKAEIEAAHGVSFERVFAAELEALRPLAADGLVEDDAGEVRLTDVGQLFMRNVAVVFDRYFQVRQARGESGRGTFSKTL